MIIEQLAANVVKTKFEVFDHQTVESAKHRLIDIVGCLIGGANGGGNRELMGLINRWGVSLRARRERERKYVGAAASWTAVALHRFGITGVCPKRQRAGALQNLAAIRAHHRWVFRFALANRSAIRCLPR